jgi:hypothetical protein
METSGPGGPVKGPHRRRPMASVGDAPRRGRSGRATDRRAAHADQAPLAQVARREALLRCVSLQTPEILNHVGGGSERRERVARRKAAFHPHATAPHWSERIHERRSSSPPSWCLAWSARLELRLRTPPIGPIWAVVNLNAGLASGTQTSWAPSRVRRDEPAVAHLQAALRPLARGRRRPIPAHRAIMQGRFAFQS